MARWLDAASQAVQLDPTNAWARYLLAQRYLYANEMRRWWAEVQRVAEHGAARRQADVRAGRGRPADRRPDRTRGGAGRAGRAARPGQIPSTYHWRQRNVYFNAGRFEEAAAAAEAIDDDDYYTRFWNTLIYAQLGRAAELQRWRAKLLEIDPDFSAEREFWRHGDFLLPEAAAERALFLDAVAKAGLPKCATPEQLERGAHHAPPARV